MQPNVRYMAVIESSLISSGLEGVQDICKGTPTVCKEEVPVMFQKLNLCIELNWEDLCRRGHKKTIEDVAVMTGITYQRWGRASG